MGRVRFLGKVIPGWLIILLAISLCVGLVFIAYFRLPEHQISSALFYRGWFYLSLAWPEEARSEFTKAVAIDPENIPARFQLGNLYYKSGNLARAKREWQEILRINPAFPPARQALEKLKQEMEKPQINADNKKI